MRAFRPLLAVLGLLALMALPEASPPAEAAALSSCQGQLSMQLYGVARVSSSPPIGYALSSNGFTSWTTGTGTANATCNMAYETTLTLASAATAASIDLNALAEGGNTMVMVAPKYIVLKWVSGNGTCSFVQGATNGYTGIGLVPVNVSASRPFAVLPVTVAVTSSIKTIDYSETGSAAVTCQVDIVGTSA